MPLGRTLAGLLVAALAMAGCTASPAEPEGGDDDSNDEGTGGGAPGGSSGGGSSGGASNDTGSDGTNLRPTALLEASAVSGQAPLIVSFTLNGSDPDGDNLTWSFDADGDGQDEINGTLLPAAYEHTYDVGTFLANLTVSDGNLTAFGNVTITVTAAPAPPPPAGPKQTVDGDFTVGLEGCYSWLAYDTAGSDPAAVAGGTLNGTTRVQFNVHQGTIGSPYRAVFTFDQGYLFVNVAFYDSDDDLVDSDASGSPNFGGITITGTVPVGAARGVIFSCGGPTEAHVHYEA